MTVFCNRGGRRRGVDVAALRVMLRNVLGVLVAALVGIHCNAATDDADGASETAELSETSGTQPGGGARRPASDEPPTSDEPARPSPVTGPDLTSLLHGGAMPVVTSAVKDESGATYATGTFVGYVDIGNTVIKSRGGKDVFVLKLDSAGQFAWVRTVGSESMESSPRVALDGKSVSVIGLTKGEMDCGSGPMATWTSGTFFLCMFGGAEGAVESGGVFPTGHP